MARLTILGSSHSVPTDQHDNTHFLIQAAGRAILVDCASSPIVRLRQAGVGPQDLTDLVLTHFHPDHVSGVALLLMDLWLLGRTAPLVVHGLAHTLDRVEQMLVLYDWRTWPHFFPVSFHRLADLPGQPVLDCPELRLTASPVCHLIPTIGLRVDFRGAGQVVAYSCDTSPCPNLVELARDADVLFHEATGESVGHSSARQAGETAAQAGARRLILIHYPPQPEEAPRLLAEARAAFAGPVELAQDFQTITIAEP